MSPKTILITGATGQQGSAVIRALLSPPVPPTYSIIALTRSAKSKAALALPPSVSAIEGASYHKDLSNHADIIPLPKTIKVKDKKRLLFSLGADIVGIVTLKFPWNLTYTRLISAPSGHKIELKDSELFFYNQVLKNDKARKTLALWISAAHSDRMNIFDRKPRIWLLTGLCLFRDATCSEIENASVGAEAALSSALVAAAGGPPIGPETGISVEKQTETELLMAGDLVWAAQWQLLNLEGVWYRSGIEGSDSQGWMVPLSISLYLDLFDSGAMKAGEGDEIAFLSMREKMLDQKDRSRLEKQLGKECTEGFLQREEQCEEEEMREDLSVQPTNYRLNTRIAGADWLRIS